MFKRTIIGLIAVGVAGAFTLPVSQAAEAGHATLRIQQYPGSAIGFTEWVAVAKGFCAKEGITCQLVNVPSSPLGLAALASNSLDIALTSTDVAIESASRGNDVQIVVDDTPGSIWTLGVRPGISLPHLKDHYPAVMQDIKGLKLGVTARGSAAELITRVLFSGAGMSPDSATYVAVGSPGTAYQALVGGKVDADMMFWPGQIICETEKTCVAAVDLTRGEGPPEIKSLNGAYLPFVAERSYIAAHPAAINAFIRAIEEASAWVKDPKNRNDLYKIVSVQLKLGSGIANPDKVLHAIVDRMAPEFDAHVDRKAVAAMGNFLLKYKQISNPVDPASMVYAKAP